MSDDGSPEPAELSAIAEYAISVGDDCFSVWCPTCEECIFENPGDRYVKNFGLGRMVPLGEVVAAIAKHEQDVHR